MSKIENIRQNLKTDGYVLVKKFFLKTKEFENFKKFLRQTIKLTSNNEIKNIDEFLSAKFKNDKTVSSYLNDNINLSHYLSSLLVSKKLISFLSKIFRENEERIIFNNPRFRIQIPGNDAIANLPWHQDIVYNKIKSPKSIVAWISLGDISKEMGPIIFKKGSHKFGVQKILKLKKKNGNFVFNVNTNNKNLKNLPNIQLNTLSGDLILIDMNTVHTSGRNNTKDKVKFSAQARYHVLKKF